MRRSTALSQSQGCGVSRPYSGGRRAWSTCSSSTRAGRLRRGPRPSRSRARPSSAPPRPGSGSRSRGSFRVGGCRRHERPTAGVHCTTRAATATRRPSSHFSMRARTPAPPVRAYAPGLPCCLAHVPLATGRVVPHTPLSVHTYNADNFQSTPLRSNPPRGLAATRSQLSVPRSRPPRLPPAANRR